MKICKVIDLGMIGYAEAAALQQRLVAARKRNLLPDVLLLCEHRHVITLGRNGKLRNLRASESALREKHVEFHRTNRGGDITYHGPGQVVGYPILNLSEIRRDAVWYVRQLEEVMIRATAAFGVNSFRVAGCTGVWVYPKGEHDADPAGREKLGAIGVHLSRWITSHGFAYNVSSDLQYFDLIVPCGIADCRAASLEKLLASSVAREDALRSITDAFGATFAMTMEPGTPDQLNEWLAGAEAEQCVEAPAAP